MGSPGPPRLAAGAPQFGTGSLEEASNWEAQVSGSSSALPTNGCITFVRGPHLSEHGVSSSIRQLDGACNRVHRDLDP